MGSNRITKKKWPIKTSGIVIDYLERTLIEVSSVTKIPIIELEGRDKHENIVKARQLYCYVAFKNKTVEISSTEIGFGIYRDHSTVLHSIKTIENYIYFKDFNILQYLNKLQGIDKCSSYSLYYTNFSLKKCVKYKKDLTFKILSEMYY